MVVVALIPEGFLVAVTLVQQELQSAVGGCDVGQTGGVRGPSCSHGLFSRLPDRLQPGVDDQQACGLLNPQQHCNGLGVWGPQDPVDVALAGGQLPQHSWCQNGCIQSLGVTPDQQGKVLQVPCRSMQRACFADCAAFGVRTQRADTSCQMMWT